MSAVSQPVFTRGRKYLVFNSSTTIGQTNSGIHLTAYHRRPEFNRSSFILSSETPSHSQNESDEETVKTEAPAKAEPAKDKDKATAKKKDSKKAASDKDKAAEKPKEAVKLVKVDYENLNNRIVALPIRSGAYAFNG